jgi:fibronectin type 3 domain-containing protein
MKNNNTKSHVPKLFIFLMVLAAFLGGIFVPPVNAAACSAPSANYGQVTTSVTIPTAATYNIWSRIMPADTTNTSYMLEIDGSQCFVVSSSAPNVWTWINYQDGNTGSPIRLSLAQGTHTGMGDNCTTNTDSTPPGVALTTPAEGSSVSGTVAVSANATDEIGVAKVEFYADSTLLNTDTSAPYSFQWNTAGTANGQHLLMAKAYDAAGNFSNSSYYVTVQNGDSQAPTPPANLSAKATAYNNVALTWTAGTDNVGVVGYRIIRNGALLTQVGAVTSLQDSQVLPSTQYTYAIVALDAAGNESPSSSPATATTPNVADTQAPSSPSGLTATAINSQQINLNWNISTDNVGVAGYDIYRATSGNTPQKIASVKTTSYGDTGLKANTKYDYYVKARDAIGNSSTPSNTASAQTLTNKRKSRVFGSVAGSGKKLAGVSITLSTNNTKYTTTTNARGDYVIRDVPFGRYNATYRGNGYATRTISLKVDWYSIEKNVRLQKR